MSTEWVVITGLLAIVAWAFAELAFGGGEPRRRGDPDPYDKK